MAHYNLHRFGWASLVAALVLMGATAPASAFTFGVTEGQQCEYSQTVPFSESLVDTAFPEVVVGVGCTAREPVDVVDKTDAWYTLDARDEEISQWNASLTDSTASWKPYLLSEAEWKFASEMADGATKTEARVAAHNHAENLTSERQLKILSEQNRWVAEVAESASSDEQNITIGTSSNSPDVLFEAENSSETMTLANGTTYNISYLNTTPDDTYDPITALGTSAGVNSISHQGYDNLGQFHITEDERDAIHQRYKEFGNVSDDVETEISTFTDNLTGGEYDDLNRSDIISPITCAQKASSEQSAGWAACTLGSANISMDGGHQVTVSVDGTNYTGVAGLDEPAISSVYGIDGADATINQSEAINMTETGGTFFVTLTDGTGDIKAWSDTEVSVEEVHGDDHVDFNSTALGDFVPSDSANALRELKDLQEQVETYETSGAGGLPGGTATIVAVAVIGAAAIAASGGAGGLTGGSRGRGR